MHLMNDLRQSENDTIPEYVHQFGSLWTQTHSRFSNSTDTLSKVLKPVYEDDTFKTAMFLTAQLLSMRSSNVDTAKALNAIQKRNKGKSTNYTSSTSNRKPNPPGQGKTAPPAKGECSWCKKNRHHYTGHVHTQCNRLREYKNKNTSGTANLASGESSETVVAFLTESTSSGNSYYSSLFCSVRIN
ncbi:hypothetical protein L211DRAFT_845788 [Terfezia boudieri ATCC MYA-4762]|uniref:Retrotransposon gag domain-containing protein n=1 Tax=Terfezia boudieri ATCC MYA-4762 TaxID=1051890 RepID=A0A3N4M1G7_9PEZI|nr:hypothetical protein L211DRAFT_845788 [Terfezia boudieri ATCC MYA-4762]